MKTKYCRHCGISYEDNENYCTRCGCATEYLPNVCAHPKTALCRRRVYGDDDRYCAYCGSQTLWYAVLGEERNGHAAENL